jgi:hypothetical protein
MRRRFSFSLYACSAIVSCAIACSPAPKPEPAAIAREAGTDEAGTPAVQPLAPLENHAWLEGIVPPGDEVGKLSVPNGATTPRPIMVALHGGGDRAEWSCGEWRGVTNGFPFIVCPHGAASHMYWDTAKNANAQIESARAEVWRDFGKHVAEGPLVLAGFSAGTWMAMTLVQGGLVEPEALVLVEGAYDVVEQEGFAPSLKARGVKRVLLVCTTRGTCPPTYRAALPKLKRVGIDARLNLASEQGHGFYPTVTFSIRRDWPWLVDGLGGWENFEPDTSPDLPGKTVVP